MGYLEELGSFGFFVVLGNENVFFLLLCELFVFFEEYLRWLVLLVRKIEIKLGERISYKVLENRKSKKGILR